MLSVKTGQAHIKNEWLKRHTFKTRDEARLAVFSYIEGFYNPQRRHSALGYRSPVEYEKMLKRTASRLCWSNRKQSTGTGQLQLQPTVTVRVSHKPPR